MPLIVISALNSAAQPAGFISGTVIDSVSKNPLSQVRLSLNFNEETAVTDAKGNFRFEKLKAGSYSFTAEKEGFAKADWQSLPSIPLKDGESFTGVTIRLSPEALISGRVVGLKGEVVESLLSLTKSEIRSHVATESTKSGEFRFRGLPAGRYKLSAQALAGARASYALTFFPSETAREQAQTIVLHEGERRQELTIVLRELRYFKVHGRFTGHLPEGRRAVVMYERASREPLGMMRTGVMDSEGRFTMEIPPGDYRLKVMTIIQNREQPEVLGYVALRVLDGDVEGVEIPGSPVRSVRAKFRWSKPGRSDPPHASFGLNPTAGLGILQYARPREDGWTTATRVSPDIYSFLFSELPKGAYVQSIRAGGANITASGLDLITGVATDLEIVLAEGGGTVTGQVMDNASNAITGARVNISRASDSQHEQALWWRTSLTGSNGSFTATDVAPGEYRITAHLNGKTSSSKTIRIVEGQRTHAQLVLP